MKRTKVLMLYAAGCSLAFSFVFVLVSAIFYEGGTALSSSLDHYSLTESLFTDMGRTKGYDGVKNLPSQWLFETGLKLLLFTLPIIHLIWVFTFARHRSRLWAGASMIFMVLACFHVWGIAEFPQDENYPRHFLFLTRALGAFSISYMAAYFAYYFEPKYAQTYATPFLIAGLVIGLRWALLIWGPEPWESKAILFWLLALQKIVWIGIYVLSIYHIVQILDRLKLGR